MSRSTEHVPPRAPFRKRFKARASEGAIAGALVFVTCLLALRFGPEQREAQAVLSLVQSEPRTLTRGSELFGEVLIVDAEDFRWGYPTFSDSVYGQVSADGRKVRVRCRDASAERAVARCSRVAALADAEFRLAAPVQALSKPVSPVHWSGVWLAVLAGLCGGTLYAAYAAVFRKSKRAPARRSRAPEAVRVSTSTPPLAPHEGSQPPEVRASSVPAPVHIFTLPPTRSVVPPSSLHARASAAPGPARSSLAGHASATGTTGALPNVEIVASGSVDLGMSVEVAQRSPSQSAADTQRPIQGHVASANVVSAVSRTMAGWPVQRAPSAANESLPAPPMPEGPLVHALALPGGYTPHPRLVQRSKDPTFDTLCTRIAWNAEGEASVVGVIGTTDGGPKAAVFAARLAWFLAAPGKLRVLLLEADFEEPAVHRVMNVEAPPQGGFSQQLQAKLGPARSEPWRVQRCAPTLDLLVESRFRAHRAAHAPQFEHAVEVFRLHYDVVVAALPPLGVVTGGAGLAYLTDGIVVVVPEGRAMREPKLLAVQTFGEQRILAVVEGAESSERITVAPNP